MSLVACDRNDYVTWHCKVDAANVEEKPQRMILKGSTMTMGDQVYNYCGSLGPQSFFDTNCSGKADQSAITFTSKTGTMNNGAQTLNCVSL